MGSLAEHKRAINKGVKYQCGKCNNQATTKGSLAGHKRALHEGVKYPCGQCNYQATSKECLAQHKRSVHVGVKFPCINLLPGQVLQGTKEIFIYVMIVQLVKRPCV